MKRYYFFIIVCAISAAFFVVPPNVFAKIDNAVPSIERAVAMAMDESHSQIFVLNRDSTISIYDFKSDTFVISRKSIPNLSKPFTLFVSPDGSFVAFFSSIQSLSFTVSIFKTNDILTSDSPKPTATYVLPPVTIGAAIGKFSDDSKTLFVIHGKNTVYFLNAETPRQELLTVGDTPRAMDFDTSGKLLVLNEKSKDLSVVDVSKRKVVATVKLGLNPKNILFNKVTDRAYVSHADTDEVYVIDVGKAVVIKKIKVDSDPVSLAYDENDGSVFAANNSAGTVSVIAPDFSVKRVELGFPAYVHSPLSLAYLNGSRKLFVINASAAKIFVYDHKRGSIVKEEKTDAYPLAIFTSEKLMSAFVRHYDANSIFAVDGGTLAIERIPTVVNVAEMFFSRPQGIVVDEEKNLIYVTNLGSDTITVIDGATQKPIKKIKVNLAPHNIFLDKKTKKLYVISPPDGSIAIVDTRNPDYPAKTVKIDGQARGGAINSRTNTFYVSNTTKATLEVLDMAREEFVSTISFPAKSFPLISSIDEERNIIYTALYGGSSVAVTNGATNKIEKQIPVGQNPIWVKHIPQIDRVFVTVEGEKKVLVIDPKTREIIQSIEMDGIPYRIFFDRKTNYVYINFRNGSDVAVLTTEENSSRYRILKKTAIPFLGTTDWRYHMVVENRVTNLAYFTSGVDNTVDVVKIERDNENILRPVWYATINADGSVRYAFKAEEVKGKPTVSPLTVKIIIVSIALILAAATALFIRKRKQLASSPPGSF
ncbi:MAG: hypothetical protein HY445_00280 [Candidatus Niyogibacteria bacterium]|nr:hypothetical protein [Candidatus Niyogibacteria bacterium]